jgi:hypothetical protein
MNRERLEIERLLSEVADEGTTPEHMEQLQALLLNRPDLQAHYARVMGLHTLLKFELDLTAHGFSSLVSARSPIKSSFRTFITRPWLRRASRISLFTALAASVLVILAARQWLENDTEATGVVAIESQELAASKAATMAVLSDLTDTALSDVTLPARSLVDTGLSLCSGAVWMERGSGQRERGYMVELPPGAIINVAVDADASANNAVAVAELDARGRPTGSVMSFKNDKNIPVEQALIGGGPIAVWSQFNDTLLPKYYLFTGTHKLEKATDDRWFLSDYVVFLNSDKLIYLGWDDSGYTAPTNPTGYFADKDFDDISAIIQIRRADDALPPREEINYIPAQLAEPSNLDGPPDSQCVFNVPPGQQALLRISNNAGWHNEVAIVDRQSLEVIWRKEIIPDGVHYQGSYLIQNNTNEVREYFVTGRHKEWHNLEEVRPWITSTCKVFRDKSPSLVLGFEDVGANEVFDEVHVHIRRVPNMLPVSRFGSF